MSTSSEPPNSIHPKTFKEWRAWLEQHHDQKEGVWLISYKKGTSKPRMDYEEAVEEALCFGWIDSKGNKSIAKATNWTKNGLCFGLLRVNRVQ